MEPKSFIDVLRRFGMAFILLAMIIALSFMNPRFFTISNFLTIMRQVAINGALAAGMTMVILTGGIDLSVGGTVALAGCFAAGALHATGNSWLAVLVALGVGLTIGSVNGFFVSYTKLPPFIVTLSTLALDRGFTLVYTEGRPLLDASR